MQPAVEQYAAAQPVESTADARRIALDGQAYTWQEYVEAYGDDAQLCWDDAYDRSSRRRIALDGQAYTWTEYVEAYGDHAWRCWDDAYHAGAARLWLAVNAYGPPLAVDSKPPAGTAAIDEETPHEDAIQHQQNDSDASQLAVNPADASQAENTTAPVLALPSVCTFQEMQEMPPVKYMGRKAAWCKQRELRQVCLQDGVWEIDLTEIWPEWRAVLQALPKNMQQVIIGDGIARVKFRLLEGSRDPGYAKIDSGERHVFEILRVDTSAVHLHYHKNGSFDDPVLVEPIVMPQNADNCHCSASQPTAHSPLQPLIGRREAVLRLTVLLNVCWNRGAGAVDITDGHAFAWKRFLANTMEHLQIGAMELEKVFALRTADSGSPKLAFCTNCTIWTMMDPRQKTYKPTRLPGLRDMSSNWRTEPLFLEARTFRTNWMRMR